MQSLSIRAQVFRDTTFSTSLVPKQPTTPDTTHSKKPSTINSPGSTYNSDSAEEKRGRIGCASLPHSASFSNLDADAVRGTIASGIEGLAPRFLRSTWKLPGPGLIPAGNKPPLYEWKQQVTCLRVQLDRQTRVQAEYESLPSRRLPVWEISG